MKDNFFTKVSISFFLTGMLMFTACDGGSGNTTGLITPENKPEIQALDELVSGFEIDTEEGIKNFAIGLAGNLPYPYNAIGAGFIGAFWQSKEDQTPQMLDAMNQKLDEIQGSLDSIQNTLANLRGQVRSDFEQVLIQNERRSIQGMADHVFRDISESYIHFKNAGISSYALDEKIQVLESKLSESIDWFMFNGNLSPQDKISTVAEFTILASLHIALLQEQINLHQIENYRPCPVGAGCEDRKSLLTAYVNKLSGKLDRYSEYLLVMGPIVKQKRLSYIGSMSNKPIYSTTSNCYFRYYTLHCDYHTYISGYTHSFNDGGLNGNQRNCYFADDNTNSSAANTCRSNYIAAVAAEVDTVLKENLYDIVDAYKTVQADLGQIEDILLPNDCVRFYKEANFSGDYATVCGVQNENWIHETLPGWNDSISSLKVGADVKLAVYQNSNYEGIDKTFNAGTKIDDLSASGLNNQISSFKIQKPIPLGKVGLQAVFNNKRVTAEAAGKENLIANRTGFGPWEEFELIKNSDGSYSLKAMINGLYVCVDNPDYKLIANRSRIGHWEKFHIVYNSDDTFALRSVRNGKYVNAGDDDLIANRDEIGSQEKFRIIKL